MAHRRSSRAPQRAALASPARSPSPARLPFPLSARLHRSRLASPRPARPTASRSWGSGRAPSTQPLRPWCDRHVGLIVSGHTSDRSAPRAGKAPSHCAHGQPRAVQPHARQADPCHQRLRARCHRHNRDRLGSIWPLRSLWAPTYRRGCSQ